MMAVTKDLYLKSMLNILNIKKCHKILGNICNKEKHVLHKRALKQALKP